MTEKMIELIEALCDTYGIDYPEPEDGETRDEAYRRMLNSYDFKSGCYIKGERMSLRAFVDVADSIGLLDDDDY